MQRRPHAILSHASRLRKARKIELLLSAFSSLQGARILEVGTGSGYMAQYFSERVGPTGRVHACDVMDQRQVTEGYEFQQIQDTRLPYQDDTFDIVITNHVIEHVGEREAQIQHLQEIRRVLKPDGYVYLAVPNRWAFIEPHYKLLFLSWLPAPLSSIYLRLRGRGNFYDCRPLSHRSLTRLLHQTGFRFHQQTFAAISVMRDLEQPHLSKPRRLALSAPRFMLPAVYPVIPTLIMILTPRSL